MKRVMTFFLAIVIMASMGIRALAAEGTTEQRISGSGSSAQISVNGTYAEAAEPAARYYVTVSWDSLEFRYSVDGGLVWNPVSMTYTNETGYKWNSDKSLNITVTNRSNRPVNVAAEMRQAEKTYGIVPTVRPASAAIPSAEENFAPWSPFTVAIQEESNHPDLTAPTEPFTIGTVTFTVTAAGD